MTIWMITSTKNHTLLVDSDSEKIAQLVIVVAVYPFVQLMPQDVVSKFYFKPDCI